MEFFGSALISFGPPFALFLFTVARDPMRVIVFIASGFFWLLALLFSSILWFAVVPLKDQLAFGLVFSVLIQEGFRFLFYKVLRKANDGLSKVSRQSGNEHVDIRDFANKHIMSYVSGLGFGVTCGAFSIVNVLADMYGPGTIGILGDSKYFFWTSSFLTLCFILLHVVWNVIFFAALDKPTPNYVQPILVVSIHMLISCLTLLNQQSSTSNSTIYLSSVVPTFVVLIISSIWAYIIAGGNFSSLKKAFVCRKGRYDID